MLACCLLDGDGGWVVVGAGAGWSATSVRFGRVSVWDL